MPRARWCLEGEGEGLQERDSTIVLNVGLNGGKKKKIIESGKRQCGCYCLGLYCIITYFLEKLDL